MATSLPWRLPQPPGLAPSGTAIQTSAAGGKSIDDSPTFSFQRRYHKLNWREVLTVDLGQIIQQIDLQSLHQQLEPITFADIGPDDVAYFTDDNFLHLFRLCQLLLEYQLFAWQATAIQANLKREKYDALKAHAGKLREALTKMVAENKGLKKEVQYCKKVIQVMEDRATTQSQQQQQQQYQFGGSVGRYQYHQHHQQPPHFMQYPPHPPLAKQEEEKESTPPSTSSTTAADHHRVHSHYASQLSEFQSQIAKEVREASARENEARNRKLEGLEQSLHLLLAAQQAEAQRQRTEAEEKRRSEEEHQRRRDAESKEPEMDEFGQPIAAPAAAPASVAPAMVASEPTPSQAAQQRLLNSIMHEVSALKAITGGQGDVVGIAAFSPREFAPPITMTHHQDQTAPSPPPVQTPMIDSPVPVFQVTPPQPTPSADSSQQSSASSHPPRPSAVYRFDIASPNPVLAAPSSSNATAGASDAKGRYTFPLTSPAGVALASSPSAGGASLAPRRSPRPSYTAEQQRELDALSKWMKDIEADELSAELAKMQLEQGLIQRGQAEEQLRQLEEAEEAEVQRIEAVVPPDHPLLQDTIMAHQAMAQSMRLPGASPTSSTVSLAGSPFPFPLPSPSPSSSPVGSPSKGLTIEVRSPMALGVRPGAPVVVGNTLVMAPPVAPSPLATPAFVPVLASTRAAVLPVAPLAPESTPILSHEERMESLLSLSPASRIRALDDEKSMIRLRAVIKARTGIDHTLYTPFPSLPFLGSLYNTAAEDLREDYDLTFLWADTAMRTEANAQELLRYAVQMDVTGEMYTEVQERLNSVMQYYRPPQSFLDDSARLRELEAHLEQTAQQEHERALREARWHEDRVTQFEAQWLALQQSEEDREYYLELQEKNNHLEAEVEFKEYLQKLEQKSRRWDQDKREEEEAAIARQRQAAAELGPLYFPPSSTATTFAGARSPKASIGGALRAAPTAAQRIAEGGRHPLASPGPASATTTTSAALASRKRAPTLPEKMAAKKKKAEQAAKAKRLAMQTGEEDEDDHEEDEDDEEDEDEEETETDVGASRSTRAGGARSNRRRSFDEKKRATPLTSATNSPTRIGTKKDDPASSSPARAGASAALTSNSTPLPKASSKIQLGSPHAPGVKKDANGLPPSNPKAATASLSKRHASSDADDDEFAEPTSNGRKHDSDDDEPDEEDDDAATRQRISNLANRGGTASSQFSRPHTGKQAPGLGLLASSSRPATAVGSGGGDVTEFHNSTPEKALAIAHEQVGAREHTLPPGNPSAGVTRSVSHPDPARRLSGGGANVAAGSLFSTSSLSRPKTSVGSSGRPTTAGGGKARTARFLTGGDEFDDDEEEEEAHHAAAADERVEESPVAGSRASPTDFGLGSDSGASRTLNPRRAAAVNLSTVGKPVAGSYQPVSFHAAPAQARNTVVGSGLLSSRPIGTLLSQHDHFGESDGNVSDVSSVMNLDDDRPKKPHDDTVIGSADLNYPSASASALPSQTPTLLSGTSSTTSGGGGGLLQTGRGRPRGQPSKLSSVANPSSASSDFKPPEEDSLSSLLGGGMRRPVGRGLTSASGFRSKLAKLDNSDNDSSLDLND